MARRRSAGWLILLYLLYLQDVPAHGAFVSVDRKLAKKRKDVIRTTGQEMTHMVNSMDRSYADQSTLQGDDPMAVTFMDSHNYNNRCRFTMNLSYRERSLFLPIQSLR